MESEEYFKKRVKRLTKEIKERRMKEKREKGGPTYKNRKVMRYYSLQGEKGSMYLDERVL